MSSISTLRRVTCLAAIVARHLQAVRCPQNVWPCSAHAGNCRPRSPRKHMSAEPCVVANRTISTLAGSGNRDGWAQTCNPRRDVSGRGGDGGWDVDNDHVHWHVSPLLDFSLSRVTGAMSSRDRPGPRVDAPKRPVRIIIGNITR